MSKHILKLLVALTLWIPASARAGTLIVPDDFPTIQEAVDHVAETAGQDTVLVRPGAYLEKVVLRSGILLKGLPSMSNPELKPRVDGLTIHTIDEGGLFSCVGLHVTGTTMVYAADGPMRVEFESCQFDSGVVDPYSEDVYGVPDTESITLTRCTVFGLVKLNAYEGLIAMSTVHGHAVLYTEYKGVILDSRFENPSRVAITIIGRDAHIARNVVQGGAAGIVVRSENATYLLIEDNEINDCAGTGIGVDGRSNGPALLRNRVTHCGGNGIVATGLTLARDNVVLQCAGAGLIMGPEPNDGGVGTVEGNVIGRCGSDGIRSIYDDSRSGWMVRNNTVYSCNGTGIVLSGRLSEMPTAVSNNISYGNGGYGLTWAGPVAPTLSGNDWFGNTAGDVASGPGATDLSVDPEFCNLPEDDVHLMATSPLADPPSCGQIGALGVGIGCGATATLVTRFDADRVAAGIQLTWGIADSRVIDQIRLERSEQATGPWTEFASERSFHGDLVVDLDRGARSDRPYWYRLVSTIGGRAMLGSPLEVGAEHHAAFALRRISPNPASGPVRFEFELAHAASISLDIYDLQGRAVARLARGSWPAGQHTVDGSGSHIAPGVYLVRYRFPGGHQDARLVRAQ